MFEDDQHRKHRVPSSANTSKGASAKPQVSATSLLFLLTMKHTLYRSQSSLAELARLRASCELRSLVIQRQRATRASYDMGERQASPPALGL